MRVPRALPLCAATLLMAAILAQSYSASRAKSAVFDEPTHIAAGLSYLRTGQIRANLQHPPLVKELAGLALWLSGIRLPENPQVEEMAYGHGGETVIGSELIAHTGPDRVLWLARLPLILLSGGLGLLLYLWGRQLDGEITALAALFLCALDPTFLGHSFLVTMDVALAVLVVLFCLALWNYILHPSGRHLAMCGVAAGAMLAAKFSAVLLLPVAGALLFIAVARPPAGTRPTKSGFLALYGMERSAAAEPPVAQKYAAAACAFVFILLVAMLMIQAFYLSPDGLYLYSAGIERINADHNPNHLAYMAGRLEHHFAGYFVLAYLLKEPLPNILLTALGLVVILRGKSMTLAAKLFLVLPQLIIFLVHSVWADDLGIRYIMAALPFTWLMAGMAVRWLWRLSAAWPRILLAGLALWLVVTAASIYPDHLAYFNEAACLDGNPDRITLAGGTACGPLWFDDSNVDWGQALKQLGTWMDHNAHGQKVRLAYFGTVGPSAYRLPVEEIAWTDLLHSPPPGLYVISAHWVAQASAHGAGWLRDAKPAAVIGHSLYVYKR